MGETTRGTVVKSANTLFQSIDALRSLDGGSPSDVANYLGVSRSTAYRHLNTLEQHGFAVCERDTYKLSYKFLDYGGYVRDSEPLHPRIIKPAIKELADVTGEIGAFAVKDQDVGAIVYRRTGAKSNLLEKRIGSRFPLHHSAGGKAILAAMTDEEVKEVIDRRGLCRATENTITDSDLLFEELAEVRDQGYAIDREETMEGLYAIGTAVHGKNDETIGATYIGGPKDRFAGDKLDHLIDELLSKVNEVELDIKYF